MKKIKRFFKMFFIGLGALVLLLVLAVTLFLNFSPQMGGTASTEKKAEYANSGHFADNKFQNSEATNVGGMSWDVMKQYFKSDSTREPHAELPQVKMDSATVADLVPAKPMLCWFGHSAFLLKMEGKTILLDPMLGETPAPVSFLGPSRYSSELPLELAKLPHIDAVVFSHDHYDHLDYASVLALKDKVEHWYTPLGVGNHLIAWGVDPVRVSELNWWDETAIGDIELVCAPARHFSGRGLFDRYATLWSSWVLRGNSGNIYFSGDSGYGTHFKEIGEKYGPFDIALMECGQYNEAWPLIHMMPEQTVQAGVDVQADAIMPIHWGAFTLALHSWTDPVTRTLAQAQKDGMKVATPLIGQPFEVGSAALPVEKWWEQVGKKQE